MATLTLSAVSKSWGRGAPVVRNVSLEVADGEVVTVLGPSGCGKSTLLRLVAGLEQPDAGSIKIGGRPMAGVEPKDRDIAMVFQSYALYPHMTVLENIATPLRLRGASKAEAARKATETAERLGLSPLLSRRPRELSGGERQRTALARALVRNPRVFLLDEPLSNLDALLRESARSELKSLFRSLKATVVYVTHDQTEAMSLSDRVAVMRAGAVEQVAPPAEVYRAPATAFVASFIGSPRMNLLAGSILGDAAATVGIRPEDVAVGVGDRDADVTLVEPLGAQQLVTLRAGALELRALLPSAAPVAARTRFRIDPALLHRFDAEGRRMA
ncbi:MAG: ABC transporter ATP-binding protein [Planctomycetia bacterium]|nr:ABC transporter ATP-binding protein [Planctomycetia bacterium]